MQYGLSKPRKVDSILCDGTDRFGPCTNESTEFIRASWFDWGSSTKVEYHCFCEEHHTQYFNSMTRTPSWVVYFDTFGEYVMDRVHDE